MAPRSLSYREARQIAASARSLSDCAELWRDSGDRLFSDRHDDSSLDRYITNARYEQEINAKYGRAPWWWKRKIR